MTVLRRSLQLSGVVVLLLSLSLTGLLYSSQPVHAETLLTWHDTGLPALPNYNSTCFDALQPNVLLVSERSVNSDYTYTNQGTFTYNWVTGQRSLLSKNNFDAYYNEATCNENTGLLFQSTKGQNGGIRYSSTNPQGVSVDYIPTHVATDGTLQMYAVGQSKLSNSSLFSSSDGGLTWQERGQQLHHEINGLSVSGPDGRAIYVMLSDSDFNSHLATYSFYFSPDAGVTWEKRSTLQGTYGISGNSLELSFWSLNGRTTSTDTLVLAQHTGGPGSTSGYLLSLSNDGGRTFNEVGKIGNGPGNPIFQIYQSGNSFFRIFYGGTMHVADNQPAFARSDDGGKTWQALSLPVPLENKPSLLQTNNAPNTLFLSEKQFLWYSSDLGQHWQKLAENQGMFLKVTPYAPFKLLGIKENRIYLLDLPDLGKSLTPAVTDSKIPDATFFDSTGHNLSGVFKTYWQQNGGLAQFGYPKTEPFREVNPSDGKVYTVQYFERNRFEYHPENKGTKYEVLLGLLGNQLTETRRAKQEQPFQPVANPDSTTQLYFPETGHNLSLSFKKYWEQNGGLSLYGYPISEEFQEINPDDGFTYTVQYFERNRFEYHLSLIHI